MFGLLYNEFIIYRWVILVYGVLVFLFSTSEYSTFVSVWSSIALSWYISGHTFTVARARQDTLLNCFPVTRKEIVRFKYLSSALASLTMFSMVYIVYFLIHHTFQTHFEINYVLIFLGFGLGMAVHIPLHLYFENRSRFDALPAYTLSALVIACMSYTSFPVILGAVIICMVLSYFISMNIYHKRDF